MLALLSCVLVAMLLSGCAGKSVVASVEANRIELAPAPIELTRVCPAPVDLPDRGLSQADVERLWSRDRASLVTCRNRHGALVRFYQDRDGRITGRR